MGEAGAKVVRLMKSVTSNEINRIISLAMAGNQEGVELLPTLLEHSNPDIKVRANDRLQRARAIERTRITNGLDRMRNISALEGELLLIDMVAVRTAHTLPQKTVLSRFLAARDRKINEEVENRKRFHKKVAKSKELQKPEERISWRADAFESPSIKAEMQRDLAECGIKTIEEDLLPRAIGNNFAHHMDATTKAKVVEWLSAELQKRKKPTKKDEGLAAKIKSRLKGN